MSLRSIVGQNDIIAEFIQCAASPDSHLEMEEAIQCRYSGVPPPYCFTWAHSDENACSNAERNTLLLKDAVALEQAAATCKMLAVKTTSMACPELIEHRNKLAEAVHRGENQLAELRYMYPLPTSHHSVCTPSHEGIHEFTPKLLVNADDRVLLWIPPLSAKTLSNNNLIFTEFTDLLYAHDFPHLGQWHCDFFHAHKEDDLTGVRDVDNYPYKPIIDALSSAFFSKDSYDNFSCAMYNISSKTLRPGCYIDVCKRSQKFRILKDFEDYAATLM